MKVNKAVFLDRDGVINKSIVRLGKPYAPLLLREFKILSGVKKTLEILKKKNFLLIVVTNQPDFKTRKLKLTELNKMNKILINKLKIDQIYVCKHDDFDLCKCRKPKNKFLEDAIKKYKINRKLSFLVGDREKDILAGLKSKLKTIYIDKNYNEPKPKKFDFKCKNLNESLEYINQFSID